MLGPGFQKQLPAMLSMLSGVFYSCSKYIYQKKTTRKTQTFHGTWPPTFLGI